MKEWRVNRTSMQSEAHRCENEIAKLREQVTEVEIAIVAAQGAGDAEAEREARTRLAELNKEITELIADRAGALEAARFGYNAKTISDARASYAKDAADIAPRLRQALGLAVAFVRTGRAGRLPDAVRAALGRVARHVEPVEAPSGDVPADLMRTLRVAGQHAAKLIEIFRKDRSAHQMQEGRLGITDAPPPLSTVHGSPLTALALSIAGTLFREVGSKRPGHGDPVSEKELDEEQRKRLAHRREVIRRSATRSTRFGMYTPGARKLMHRYDTRPSPASIELPK